MYWEALLKEIQEQKSLPQVLSNCSKKNALKVGEQKPKIEYKKFFLGEPYENIYFTMREAEVMVQLIYGKTITAAAAILNLSPRTIEFYVKNMKTKLACRTKSELIGKVFDTNFVRNITFNEE